MTTEPETTTYELRLRGRLDARWAATLGVETLVHEAGGITLLQSRPVDQPALHGLLQQLRDLGLPLISVTRIEPNH
jgi:hypothetical protein